jgi:hypothetical protein
MTIDHDLQTLPDESREMMRKCLSSLMLCCRMQTKNLNEPKLTKELARQIRAIIAGRAVAEVLTPPAE